MHIAVQFVCTRNTLLALNITKKNSKNTLRLGNKENGQYCVLLNFLHNEWFEIQDDRKWPLKSLHKKYLIVVAWIFLEFIFSEYLLQRAFNPRIPNHI